MMHADNLPTTFPADPTIAPLSAVHDPLRYQYALVQLSRRARGSCESAHFLAEAAQVAAEGLGAGGFFCGELLPDRASVLLRYRAITESAPLLETGTLKEMRIAIRERSLLAELLSAETPIGLEDIAASDFRHEAWLRQLGWRTGLFCRVGLDDQPYGVLGLFGPQIRCYEQGDLLLVESVANLASTTLGRVKAEFALTLERRWSEAVIDRGSTLVLVLSPEGRIVRCNRALQETTHFSLEELKGRMMWGAFLIPEEVGQVRGVLEGLRKGASETSFECYMLTKDGVRRRVAWTFAVLRGASGAAEQLVGSGIDITEKCEALERLEKAHSRAASARKTIDELQGALDVAREELSRRKPGSVAVNGVSHTDAAPSSEPEEIGYSAADPPLAPVPSSDDDERRTHRRTPYPYLQVIAPVVAGRLPDRGMFREVRCHDISSGGFSFLSPVEPQHQEIVVAFGQPPQRIYLRAAIAHVSSSSYNGARVYQVGCRYLERVEINAAPRSQRPTLAKT